MTKRYKQCFVMHVKSSGFFYNVNIRLCENVPFKFFNIHKKSATLYMKNDRLNIFTLCSDIHIK